MDELCGCKNVDLFVRGPDSPLAYCTRELLCVSNFACGPHVLTLLDWMPSKVCGLIVGTFNFTNNFDR